MNSKVKQRHARGIYGPLAEYEAEVAEAEAKVTAKAQQRALTTPEAGLRSFEVGEADHGQRIDKFLAAQAAAAAHSAALKAAAKAKTAAKQQFRRPHIPSPDAGDAASAALIAGKSKDSCQRFKICVAAIGAVHKYQR